MTRASLLDELPYVLCIDKNTGTILNEDYSVQATLRIEFIDMSFLSEDAISEFIRGVAAVFNKIENAEGWHFYFNVIRQAAEPPAYVPTSSNNKVNRLLTLQTEAIEGVFTNQIYLTFHKELLTEGKVIGKLLFKHEAEDDRLMHHTEGFVEKVSELAGLLEKLSAVRNMTFLSETEHLEFLNSCLSDENRKIRLPKTALLKEFLLANRLKSNPCMVNDSYIVVVSLRDFGHESRYLMLNELLSLPYEFRISTRFTFLDGENAKEVLEKKKKSYKVRVQSPLALLLEHSFGASETKVDEEALRLAESAEEAQSELASGLTRFGYLSSLIVIKDKDGRRAVEIAKEIRRVLTLRGMTARIESAGLFDLFLSSMPAINGRNPIRPILNTVNLCHILPTSSNWQGSFVPKKLAELSPVNSQPLLVTKSPYGLFYFNLIPDGDDVGHALVVGRTGGGKSVFLNTCALAFLKYEKARVISFDVDRSCERMCRYLSGTFFELGNSDNPVRFNPFSLLRDENYFAWFADFLAYYFEECRIRVDSGLNKEIQRTLKLLVSENKHLKGFAAFQATIQPEDLKEALEPFVSGSYAAFFCEGEDAVSIGNNWTAFEMRELLSRDAKLCRFVLGYLFKKLELSFTGEPTLLLLDEAWMFLNNAFFAGMIKDWLKTLRKKNVSVVLATQELADAGNSAIFSTIVSSCLTKICLPDSGALNESSQPLYRSLGLSAEAMEVLSRLEAKKEYLYSSPQGLQVFDLALPQEILNLLKPIQGVIS
jgi:type IV secretion/conjugal transfer VirB4 family ATPase